MQTIVLTAEFRGHATWLEPGVLLGHATAPTEVRDPWIGSEAHLESRKTFFDDGRFEETGTIGFGDGNAIRFRSVGTGLLERTPEPELRHGAVALRIDSGAGFFARVTGRVVSNFLLSDTGELTDTQVIVAFALRADRNTGHLPEARAGGRVLR
jgi:hypothetical protein